ELRGHGLSNQQLQLERGLHPKDLDWDWDIDSYFLYDVPAAVAAVKQATGRSRIFYLGNSMGGMLGYGYAGCHDDLAGLVARAATESNLRRYELISRYIGSLLNPSRVTAEDFRWLLSQGGEKEPRRVVEQFARWIRHDEMKCYRTGYDYKAHFRDIAIPMAIF